MRKICSKCKEEFTLSIEEEELDEAGFLNRPICDDCFEDEESNCFGGIPEYESCSDADCGL